MSNQEFIEKCLEVSDMYNPLAYEGIESAVDLWRLSGSALHSLFSVVEDCMQVGYLRAIENYMWEPIIVLN